MSRPTVAIATCSALPDLDPEDAALLPALAERGVEAVATVWDAPDVDWAGYDLVVIRSTWDYAPRRAEFLAWADRLPRVLNPAPALRWNTDKRYLTELEAMGVPVVPTAWLDPARQLTARAVHTRFPSGGEFVVKPAVGAGSVDAGRYTANDANSRALAVGHAVRLLTAGRTVMVQRYVEAVDTAGETGLVFIDGEFSHAVRKGAMLHGPDEGVDGLFRPEEMSATTATTAELDVARQALAAVHRCVGDLAEPLLYARVDLVQGAEGTPLLMEVELTEPSLFTSYADGAAARFADAIARRVLA